MRLGSRKSQFRYRWPRRKKDHLEAQTHAARGRISKSLTRTPLTRLTRSMRLMLRRSLIWRTICSFLQLSRSPCPPWKSSMSLLLASRDSRTPHSPSAIWTQAGMTKSYFIWTKSLRRCSRRTASSARPIKSSSSRSSSFESPLMKFRSNGFKKNNSLSLESQLCWRTKQAWNKSCWSHRTTSNLSKWVRALRWLCFERSKRSWEGRLTC